MQSPASSLPEASTCFPPAQSMQPPSAITSLYWPAGQALHSSRVKPAVCVPPVSRAIHVPWPTPQTLAQSMQLLTSSTSLYWPDGHKLHSSSAELCILSAVGTEYSRVFWCIRVVPTHVPWPSPHTLAQSMQPRIAGGCGTPKVPSKVPLVLHEIRSVHQLTTAPLLFVSSSHSLEGTSVACESQLPSASRQPNEQLAS